MGRRLACIAWVVLCTAWDPPTPGPLFLYNRQRQQWERVTRSEVTAVSGTSGNHAKIDEMLHHLDTGGLVEVAKEGERGTVVFRTDDASSLPTYYKEAAKRPTKNIEPHDAFELAVRLQKQQDRTFPVLYHAIIEANPAHFSAYYNMGSWLHSKGRWAEAQQLFEAAHKIRPFHLLPKISLSEVYAQTGNPAKAMKMLEQLPLSLAKRELGELVATSGDTMQNLRVVVATAMLMHRRGLFRQAEEQYSRAIRALKKLDPDIQKHSAPLMYMNYGVVCHQLNWLDKAKAGYDKALELMPKLSMFLRWNGGVLKSVADGAQLPQPLWPLWGATVLDADGAILIQAQSSDTDPNSENQIQKIDPYSEEQILKTLVDSPIVRVDPNKEGQFSLGKLFGGWM